MQEQQKCVKAVLKSALVVNYEEDEVGSRLSDSSHPVKKVGWALEFDNGIRLISKNQLVEVGAPYEIKYTIRESGAIRDISAVPIAEEKDKS